MMRPFRRRHSRGQSLVEFTLVLPVIMMLALTIAEFGMAFGTNMTLIEATREGARVGAVLNNGSGNNGLPGCTGAANVDPQIMLAVQRVIESPGSGIKLSNIDWVHIYLANATGGPSGGSVNVWTVGNSSYCGLSLSFVQTSVGWNASTRSSALPAASIGVSIQYRYQTFTPLAAIAKLAGLSTITMVDSTVMDLEP
ncbi:MAG TPA: TadE family protein [Candidatus Limnocylindrales bacterium]